MNARLYPMSRRCVYCGSPLLKGRVCAEHKPLLRNDPWYAAEVSLNTMGAAPGSRPGGDK